ncbi:MAG: hypothetical protein ACAH83_01975 [Alphaproteobacteria bacterium]
MSIREEAKEIERKVEKSVRETFPEIEVIKENVVGLAHNLKDVSNDKAHMAVEYMHEKAENLKVSGTDTLAKIEKSIKANPAQSVGIAFAAGIVASYLLGRRAS